MEFLKCFVDERFINKAQFDAGFAHRLILKDGAVPAIKDPGHDSELQMVSQGSKLRPFWSHMLPKCNLCDSKIYLGAYVRVQIIVVVRPLQFSAKRSRITAQHVPRDR